MQKSIGGSEEFLIVRHSILNGNQYDIGKWAEDTLKLEKYTNGRKVVPCFEGDVLQVAETGEIVLTHQNFLRLSQQDYTFLREKKLAAPLEGVLEGVGDYKRRNGDQRIVLCFELKTITENETIDRVVKELKNAGLRDVYFDSFFGGRLDVVKAANEKQETNYGRSLHLIGNIGKCRAMTTKPVDGYDILTVPYPTSFGDIGEPVIYGAVSSTDILRMIAENPKVIGAYLRLKEGMGIKGNIVKLFNSLTNTEKLRRDLLSNFD